jgi:hypothetical protein
VRRKTSIPYSAPYTGIIPICFSLQKLIHKITFVMTSNFSCRTEIRHPVPRDGKETASPACPAPAGRG